jgi:putative transcriptional regulator
MTRIHMHPSDETLLSYARGNLDAGRRLVVEAHLELCRSCAGMIGALDHIAGKALDAAPPMPLEDATSQKVLQRIAANPVQPDTQTAIEDTASYPYGLHALAGRKIGPWRWVGPGVHWRAVSSPASGARVFMLKAAPGIRMPDHTHTGTELTLVLTGAFSHDGGRFACGDVEDADSTVDHQPVVEDGEECVCLVAMEGQLHLRGWIGRLMQPFVRM